MTEYIIRLYTTHINGHTLDLVISRENNELNLQSLAVKDFLISDHYPVITTYDLRKQISSTTKTIHYRNIKGINNVNFSRDIDKLSQNIMKCSNMMDVIRAYNNGLSHIINDHAPLKSKIIRDNMKAPWFNNEIQMAKISKRRAERKWLSKKTQNNKICLRQAQVFLTQRIKETKSNFYIGKIESTGHDSKKLFQLMNGLLSPRSPIILPAHTNESQISNRFADYFIDKINIIRNNLSNIDRRNHKDINTSCSSEFSEFRLVSEDDVHSIITKMSSATCDLDPIPTNLVKGCIQAFLPIITFIVNMSLNTAIMPNDLKKAIITPIIKKLMMDPEILKNYRPISNVSFISKVIEKCVAMQITLYIADNNMACKWQSAYREGHSTETALICVFNDILLKLDANQCVALVLLDLSAAFDTIDRAILSQRLENYYGIKGSVSA